MCGIIGYSGHRPAVPVVIEGLRRLEYRGYDSSGISFCQHGTLNIIRAPGKLRLLEDKLASMEHSLATTSIGHTRWATHGAPTEANAHPHQSFSGEICIVHNGIIENYQELKNELIAKGITFHSQTDTEVLVNCIAGECKEGVSLLQAFANALKRAHGAYAVAMLSRAEPNVIYAARHSAPLLLGIGTGENFVASDIPAFLPYTRDVVFLEDGEIVRITPTSWQVLSLDDFSPKTRQPQRIDWDVQSAQRGGYRHFMLKEIFEQPQVITDCTAGRLSSSPFLADIPELVGQEPPARLRIVACGTSYHAGLWAHSLFEQWAQIPAAVEIASEFRYRKPLFSPGEVVLVISQSGETADTLAALRIAREKGCKTIGLCNVVGSSIAREADTVIYTQAGPEISVASTKALCSQMVLLMIMALAWGQRKNCLDSGILENAIQGLEGLPNQLRDALPAMQGTAKALAMVHSDNKGMFFLGRGPSFPLALEGALKVKELSYIHAEGYAAGEMKHGPIALVEPDFLSVILAPDDPLLPKTMSNMEEVQARKGPVILLANPSVEERQTTADHVWIVPAAWGPLASLLLLPALQLFSYETASYLGNDVDQPRNLAKSVTVE